MTLSSRTLRSPTRTPRRLEARARAGLVAVLLAGGVQAHDPSGTLGIPAAPGWRAGAAVAGGAYASDTRLPAARLPGFLTTGELPAEREGLALEHATVDLGVLAPAGPLRIGAAFAYGWHGEADSTGHVETAWVAARGSATGGAELGAGRRRVPMGRVVEQGGNFDRFAQAPLAKRALLNDDWIDDGVLLGWRREHAATLPGIVLLEAGLWRGESFPGGRGGPLAPSLRVQWAEGGLTLDGFFVHLEPEQRATRVQASEQGHEHTLPDCAASLRGLACFGGRVDVASASLSWTTPLPGVRLAAALLYRDEAGELYSGNGNTAYSGQTWGGWFDALWQVDARFDLGLRLETLHAAHELKGAGAGLVARDAGIDPYQAAWRAEATAGWTPLPAWSLRASAGHESGLPDAGSYVALRLLWTPESVFSAPW